MARTALGSRVDDHPAASCSTMTTLQADMPEPGRRSPPHPSPSHPWFLFSTRAKEQTTSETCHVLAAHPDVSTRGRSERLDDITRERPRVAAISAVVVLRRACGCQTRRSTATTLPAIAALSPRIGA